MMITFPLGATPGIQISVDALVSIAPQAVRYMKAGDADQLRYFLLANRIPAKEEICITRNGKIAGIIVSPDEYESWKETLAVRSDKALMKEIRQGLKALKRTKKTYTLDELFNED